MVEHCHIPAVEAPVAGLGSLYDVLVPSLCLLEAVKQCSRCRIDEMLWRCCSLIVCNVHSVIVLRVRCMFVCVDVCVVL